MKLRGVTSLLDPGRMRVNRSGFLGGKMRKLFQLFVVAAFVQMSSNAADIPKGFEEPGLMDRLLAGKIVTKRIVDTQTESKVLVRSFYKKVSTDAYIELAVNYPKYADMFQEVREGKLLKVNAEKTQYDYKLHVVASVGIITKHVYPEFRHSIGRAKTTLGEARVENLLLNYKDQMEIGAQSTRLIPFQDGILVEDFAHVKARGNTASAKAAKRKFIEFFLSYTKIFRDELKGGY
jgi:hypothetical protein